MVFVTMTAVFLIIVTLMLELFRSHKRDFLTTKVELSSLNREIRLLNDKLNVFQDEFNGVTSNQSEDHRQILEVIGLLRDSQTKSFNELRAHIDATYMQTESLFSLFSSLRPDIPFPKTRGWAASPDFLKQICSLVLTKKPALVFETGSGVSTLVIAYCLKKLGKGKIISLDHLTHYADETLEMIAMHGLSEYAEIYHAPLKETLIGQETWLWYDLDGVKIDKDIDILIIDGPPATTQPLARYPVLPMLYHHLGKDVVALLDDGARQDEKDIVERYKTEFPKLTYRYLDFEKGAFIMTRS